MTREPPPQASTPLPSVEILLDIDGTLSPIAAGNTDPRQHGPWWDEAIFTRVAGLPCWYSPALIAGLDDLADQPGVTLRFLTTWEHELASTFASTVGLHVADWPAGAYPTAVRPYAGEPSAPGRSRSWWKAQTVAGVLEHAEPQDLVVWADDQIGDFSREGRVASVLGDPRLSALAPARAVGLTASDLAELQALVAAHLDSSAWNRSGR